MNTNNLRIKIIFTVFMLLWLPIAVSMGEGKLPAIIKRVEPHIVVLLTYNKEGRLLG